MTITETKPEEKINIDGREYFQGMVDENLEDLRKGTNSAKGTIEAILGLMLISGGSVGGIVTESLNKNPHTYPELYWMIPVVVGAGVFLKGIKDMVRNEYLVSSCITYLKDVLGYTRRHPEFDEAKPAEEKNDKSRRP